MPDNEKFEEGVAKDKIQNRVDHYNGILNSDTYDKNSTEYIYAQDVIEEITNLLKRADEEKSFVNSIDIQNRIESYLKSLEYIDRDYLESKKEELEGKVGNFEETSSFDGEAEELTIDELLAEIDRIANLDVIPPSLDEIQEWKSSRPQVKAERKAELDEVEKAIKELSTRDNQDIEAQRRTTKNRIKELQELNKEKELFKITEKGENVIEYPDIIPEPDMETAKREYEYRKQDMVDKFYGNKEKEKMYSSAMFNLRRHIISKEFEYKDENGNIQKSEYQTVEPYDEMPEDLKLLQLEEYVERLERITKAEAGDLSVYKDVQIRDKDGKIIKVSPQEARKADEQYIETNNNAYNKLTATRQNLRTFGKYGEKVPYSEFQKGQPVRNIVRAVGNAGRFIRNYTTAPINRLFGKIVSPIYGKVSGADYKVKGLYQNKRTHRYVARREYYESQGKGFFSSRFNSIFHAKEANKAILSAGAYDIYESIKQKYVQLGEQEAFNKKAEFASKSVDEKIEMLKADMETADEEGRAKLEASLKDLEKAKQQISADKLANQRVGAIQTIQTDAIDIAQHDKANKENVTRTITGVKLATRLGFAKLVGPKIRDWLLSHAKTTKNVPTTIEEFQSQQIVQGPINPDATPILTPEQEKLESILGLQERKWVSGTKQEFVHDVDIQLNTDATMAEVMSANAGKQIEGFYSVYGGERRPAMYDLTGNEKITAIFESMEKGGKGLSDTAGLKAPTLTDGTFASELLDANGVLNQNTTLSQMLEAIENGSMKVEELSNVYVGVDDRYWTKLSDLVEGLTKEVALDTGSLKDVVTTEGKWVELTNAERIKQLNEAILKGLTNPIQRMKIQTVLRDTVKSVENPRVVKVLERLGMATRGADGALIVDDVYENVRHTRSNIKPSKTGKRAFEADMGFTGTRKSDMNMSQTRQESFEDMGER